MSASSAFAAFWSPGWGWGHRGPKDPCKCRIYQIKPQEHALQLKHRALSTPSLRTPPRTIRAISVYPPPFLQLFAKSAQTELGVEFWSQVSPTPWPDLLTVTPTSRTWTCLACRDTARGTDDTFYTCRSCRLITNPEQFSRWDGVIAREGIQLSMTQVTSYSYRVSHGGTPP